MKVIERYEYLSRDGIKMTDWFPIYEGDDCQSFIDKMNEIKNKYKHEYKII